MKASEKTRNRKASTPLLIAVTAFVLVAAVGVGIFLRFYSGYIDGVLYHERLHQMQEEHGAAFRGLASGVYRRFRNCVQLDLLTMKKQARLNGTRAAAKNSSR